MNISPSGIAFIEANEGFRSNVYTDSAGHMTIGYGHKLLPGESFPGPITQQQAQRILLNDLELVELTLAHQAPVDCTQNQWDALCDFGFNEGAGSLRKMLAHGWDQVPVQMPRWNLAEGVVLPGLTGRREREVALFQS